MTETFRPKSNFVWAGTSISLIFLFTINSLVVIENRIQVIFEITFGLFLGVITYLVWVRPKLILHEKTLEVVNPLRSEVIHYKDIIEFETKWALRIIHSKGVTRVWVAPATGKRKWIADKRFGWYGSSVPLSNSDGIEYESMSASLDSSSGQAAYMIRERIKRQH